MQVSVRNIPRGSALRIGVLAGLAGGAAEVIWIIAALALLPGTPGAVAAAVTGTVAPGLGAWSGAVWLGIAIHMALAVGLGVLVAVLLRRVQPGLAGSLTEAALLVAILAGVWTVNFLVVLPVINPAFVHIVPMPVSFVSKLLFGVAAAVVFWLSQQRQMAKA